MKLCVDSLLSRTITLAGNGKDVLFRPMFTEDSIWRLVIATQEAGSLISIQMNLLQNQSTEKHEFTCSTDGVEFVGNGSAVIEVQNLTGASVTIDGAMTAPSSNNYPFEFQEEAQTAVNGVYSDIGANGGYSRAFTNYLALYSSGNINLRIVDPTGAVVYFEALNLEPNLLILNQFRTSGGLRYQVAGNAANRDVKAVWYNRR